MFEEIKDLTAIGSKISLKGICTGVGALVVTYGVISIGNTFLTALFGAFKTLI